MHARVWSSRQGLGLEVSTAEPVLPATPLGLSARGRGVVRRRDLGGSIVWALVPPIVGETALPPGQAEPIVRALDAFAAAGEVALERGRPPDRGRH